MTDTFNIYVHVFTHYWNGSDYITDNKGQIYKIVMTTHKIKTIKAMKTYILDIKLSAHDAFNLIIQHYIN